MHFPWCNNSRYVRLPETPVKKNPDNIILLIGTNNSVNDTSRDILNEVLSLTLYGAVLRICIFTCLIYLLPNWKKKKFRVFFENSIWKV